MKKYIEHVTSSNERWDTLAYKYYGDAKLYEPIIRANEHIKVSAILDEGIKLYIPIGITMENETEKLTPWT